VSSRLLRSAGGRPVAVEITTPMPELEVGYRFRRLLGDELRGVYERCLPKKRNDHAATALSAR
jgi:hypothetical protein